MYVNNAGTVAEVQEIWVNNGGTVSEVTEAWVNNGGTVQQWWEGRAVSFSFFPGVFFPAGGGSLTGVTSNGARGILIPNPVYFNGYPILQVDEGTGTVPDPPDYINLSITGNPPAPYFRSISFSGSTIAATLSFEDAEKLETSNPELSTWRWLGVQLDWTEGQEVFVEMK